MNRDRADRIGRTLMIGFETDRFDAGLEALLREIRPGGIILFKRNLTGGPRETAGLIEGCQNAARDHLGRDLLVAVDQEGGPVLRLGPPFARLPSQRQMARTMTLDQVRTLASDHGRSLRAAGFNFNLAPVLDVNTDPEASYMTERCFSPDPDTAADYGRALMDGYRDAGVLTCAKHFPGIGDVRVDPHQDLPTVEAAETHIREKALPPFAAAVQDGVPAVMSAHVRFPALDPDRPATFSTAVMTDLLRREIGFTGPALTDDLEMGAVIRHWSIGPAAVASLNAGCDLLLICRRPDLIREAVFALDAALDDGTVTADRLDRAAGRIEAAQAVVRRAPTPDLEEVFPS